MRIAALASGSGSNLKTILTHASAGRLDVEPVLVLSNNPAAEALDHARAYNVPIWSKAHRGIHREDFDAEMLCELKACGAEAVILAGYMRLLGAAFLQAFKGRILNIHPAILPSFAGTHGGRDALNYQARLTGCTVHFVDEIMDNGPVVIQAAVPVSAEDSLSDLMPRIHALEHRIYPQAIQWLAQGRLRVDARKVTLLPLAEARRPGQAPALGSAGGGPLGPWLVSPALEDF